VSVDVGGNAMRVPCYSCECDPRDARIAELEQRVRELETDALDCGNPPCGERIAELEAALAGLVAATKVHAEYHGPAAEHHRDECPEDGACTDCLFDRNICDHIEAAERALGRRK
jgi:hypothetical protein